MPRSKQAVRAPARFADGMEPVPASINAEEVSVPVASGSGNSAPVTSAQGSANGQVVSFP